ncbi:MAG: glycosyltransferase family 2 protein [Ammonifex sp.]|jgi:glycosyltransferase involved in cell wall biosynthesis|nr:MAG: glycosyltransferase family 2 protein [Ammonifex sp.]
MKTVSVVIPAYNEACNITKVVESVRQIPEVSEVIVVDDASSDETSTIAIKAGAKVICLPVNSGKGEAVRQGIAVAAGDVVVLLDADLGESAAHARALILPVLSGEADMTVARFPSPRKKGGFGLVRGLARAGIRYFTGLEVTAPLSGQRAISRDALHAVQPLARGFGVEVALTIKAARRGYSIREVPVSMSHRETGRDLRGFLHRGRQFRDVLFTLGRLYYEYRFCSKVAD